MRIAIKKTISFLTIVFLPLPSSASLVPVSHCYYQAAKDYGIDADLLIAIGIKESRLNNHAINRNSFDYCQMQVNRTHRTELEKFGINPVELTNKPCACIYTGAWVLAKFFKQYGVSWNTVGMYNAGARNTPRLNKIRQNYSNDVKAIYTILKQNRNKANNP